MAVTLDAGALLLADRSDRRFWAWWKRAVQLGEDLTVPAPVLAQAWRDGSQQSNLSRMLKACRFVPMSEALSRRSGELCGRTRTADVVDALVAVIAAEHGDDIFTSDPDDIRPLLLAAGGRGRVFTADDL